MLNWANPLTLYRIWPPIAAAILAYSVIGRLLPTADTGLLAIACWLYSTRHIKMLNQTKALD